MSQMTCVGQVRQEFVDFIADLLTGMVERRDHEARLVPYLLASLPDPLPSVADRAAAALKRVGAMYEVEHADDLKVLTSCTAHRP